MLFSEKAGQTIRTSKISFVDFDEAQRGDITSKWNTKKCKNCSAQKER